MTLAPKKEGVYHISSLPRGVEYDENRVRVFRGHGSDSTQYTDNVLCIMSDPLERVVTFKSFFDGFKINLTKEIEKKEEQDKTASLVKQYSGKVEYDISINIPAHSVNEAVNNIAKIEELQKLIAPLDKSQTGGVYDFISANSYTAEPRFMVFMKNLISNGNPSLKLYGKEFEITAALIREVGLPCMIDTVSYDPDVEAGFFEFDNYFYPKNIKLSLKMTLDQTIEKSLGDSVVIQPFDSMGNFDESDIGTFPFGVGVDAGISSTDPAVTMYGEANSLEVDSVYTTQEVNELDYSGERESTYVFISNNKVNTNQVTGPGAQRARWLVFKPFIESFNRAHRTDIVPLQSKTLDINGGIKPGSNTTFGDLTFSLKLNLPAKDLEESKKNCGKLSHLTRMFFKKQNDLTLNQSTLPQKGVWVYIPGMLEIPDAVTGSAPSSTDYSAMKYNAVPLFFENLSFDVDLDAGFFEENGKLYPKAMSIDFAFFYNSGDLIKNYRYNSYLSGEPYEHIVSPTYPGKEHLFPYNRKTIKLGS